MNKLERITYYFFALDKNLRFTFVSAKAATVFHRDPALLIGKNILEEFPGFADTNLYAAYIRALSEQKPVYVDEFFPSAGWFENHIYPSPGGLSIYGRDISEKREMERKLRRNIANLDAIINNTELLLWSVDRKFRLMSFNKPFAKFLYQHFDMTAREGMAMLEQPVNEENIPRLTKWTSCFQRVLSGATVIMQDSIIGMEFECTLRPIREGNKIIGISVMAANANERKDQESMLAQANKQIGDLKSMALRSVMNPHFIFNTLNSIQYYILENKQANAISYLSSFSKLMRGILDSAMNNTVRLADELEMLSLYVKLELMRFDNSFDFSLEVDPAADVDNIEIPSMLIQPFVENAILHGLSNKPDRGSLTIRVKQQEEVILFEIDDNGIGRQAARNMQDMKRKHKSLGISVTEERLRLLNASEDASFEIIDKEKNGRPAGTLVRVWVRLEIKNLKLKV